MSSLHELQRRVMDALLSDSPASAASLVALPTDTAAARLRVYRGNVMANFLDGLRSTYPALLRLVGEDYFRQMAREFHGRFPSRSGDLRHAGEPFAGYVAERHRAGEFRYLADVARLEWLIQESLLAAEHAPFDLGKLAAVAPSAYDTLRFDLHPALRLFASPYPALRIWEANVDEDTEPPPIDLDSGADRVAIMRLQLRPRFLTLSRGEYDFLNALGRGDPLSAAVDAGANDAAFDASAALQRLVAAAAIVDCRPG